MRYTILIVAIGLIFIGCKKNKSTRPVLTFTSVNNTTVPDGGLLIFTLSFKNIRGNALDSIYIQEVPVDDQLSCDSGFHQTYALPVFTSASNQGGNIVISFINNLIQAPYPFISAKCAAQDIDDTSHFKFVLQDQYQNKSDTVVSPQIIIKRPTS